MSSQQSLDAAYSAVVPKCSTCADTGWLCAHSGGVADFHNGTCCQPWEHEFAPLLGRSCPSADGCPDCGPAMDEQR